jgi:hypothetical protein
MTSPSDANSLGSVCRHAAMVLSALLALGAISVASAQQPTADAIIARYAEARGGLARIKALRTIMYRGVYTEGTFTLDNAVLSLMRPYYKLVGDPTQPPHDFAEGYDGSAWEFYEKPGVVLRTVGAASAAGRHAVYIDGPLIGYKERGWAVSVVGVSDVGDRKAFRLLVRMADGYEEEELVDTATFLVIAERKSMAIHAFGDKVTSESRLSDYRPVEGVLFAFTDREVEVATGRVLNEMHYKSITANVAFDSAAFSPPVFVRTRLQSWVEQLYAERADSSAVLWSYRDFRVANPTVDTHADVEFIGYQMLKMGDFQTAIALLMRNAGDFPNVATAAFGLGRAYKSAGDTEKARAQFTRALEIDPLYKPARQALDAKKGSPQ